ncbi:hemicentin-2-like [Rhipicephalus sanguineus]|uniref:hemicentin-2-like n=1 Tax=Rhipicephalus sanguineus TaxID=34632 RepID=UPI001894A56A|nr:hemicentin-2-like [Rhipicephalus sanguineus]
MPGDRDHGARLRCLASNSAIAGAQGSTSAPLEDSWTLDVHYKPVVQLRLGSGLRPSNIHEGIDIYFECSVRSNPPVSEVSWTFDGRDLHTDGSRGIIVSNQSLALRSVNRTNSGFYACHAANSEGEAESNRLRLRVLHSPVCHSGHLEHSHSVAKHETVEVECDVEADPSNVTFSWSFHQAHRAAPLSPNSSFSTPPGAPLRSVLRYTPRSDADYGTLYCRARNAVGDSLEPCIFQIHPVGPPVTPYNCSVEEVTSEGVHVVCQRSGAGQQQTFLLELQDGQSAPIVTNFTSGQPSFRVHSLRPATRYQMALYGINANGRSEPVHLTVFTLPVGRGLVSKADAEWSLGSTTLWAAALSAVAAFLIVFIALTLGKFRRKILFNRGQNVWNRNESAADSCENEEKQRNSFDRDVNAGHLPSEKILTPGLGALAAGIQGTDRLRHAGDLE